MFFARGVVRAALVRSMGPVSSGRNAVGSRVVCFDTGRPARSRVCLVGREKRGAIGKKRRGAIGN
jgi:hypothetical protein